jgi:hypothetical protein
MNKNRERRVAYNNVIQDLYAKRVQLNQAIEALEALLSADDKPRGASAQAFAAEEKANGPARADAEETGGTLIAAIKSVLRRSDRPLGNAEIFRQLKSAGVKFRSSNPQLSVSQVLSRNSKSSGRGRWALQ